MAWITTEGNRHIDVPQHAVKANDEWYKASRTCVLAYQNNPIKRKIRETLGVAKANPVKGVKVRT